MNDHTLVRDMQQLVTAQLVVEESPENFAFRHALMRDAVYATLLVRERRRYHAAVAEALAQAHAPSLDAQSAALAYHYYEAGAWAQALVYARRAGEKAQAMYAPREAIQHFSRALDSAAQLEQPAPAGLHRARGQAYETIGDFEHARADFEASLQAGRAAGERRAEWQALVDLGFLWASRDYGRTGEYLRQAVDQARTLGDPAVVAQSLNRLGNWYANVEQPAEALRYHGEALTIFESLGDKPGVAATVDLLGLASAFVGDVNGTEKYFRRAIALFRELGDRPALASALANLSQGSVLYFVDLVIEADTLTSADGLALVEEALAISRAIGWRAGEAYALLTRAMLHGARGAYTMALADGHAGLAIAVEIEHQQWTGLGELCLGMLYFDLVVYDRAHSPAESAGPGSCRRLAELRAHDRKLPRRDSGAAGSARKRKEAEAALNSALGDESRSPDALPVGDVPLTMAVRLCWQARADLAVADGKPRLALQIMDGLVQRLPNREMLSQRPPSRIALSRAIALSRMARPADKAGVERRSSARRPKERATQAELLETFAWLQAVQAEKLVMESPPLQARLHIALGRLYRAQRGYAEARDEFASAREIVASLAEQIEDVGLRRNYLARAMRLIPAAVKRA